MPEPALARHFPSSYADARRKFEAAATRLGAAVQAFGHPTQRGIDGEELAMDVLRLGPAEAKAALIVSSGVHGVEGFCGSGIQVALTHDADLLARLERQNVALLLIHAVNPYGFSHLRRTNEDNVDLNRNFIDFEQPLPRNEGYAEVHALMLPPTWPPTQANADAIARFMAERGERAFRDFVSLGQVSHPDGLFHRGRAPAWSNLTLREVLRSQGRGHERLAWIDIHTGLGPCGHGEKMFASHREELPGRHDPRELLRARAIWGADVFSNFSEQSQSRSTLGGGITCLPYECPWAETTAIGLEFGTLARPEVMHSLRTMHWLANHPEIADAERRRMGREALGGFYIDHPEWQGMVFAQARVMVLQAISALAAPT